MFLSTLLTSEYLFDGLQKDPKALPTPEVCAYFAEELSQIYAQIPEGKKLNEAETERLIVSKVLNALGWKEQFLTQQKMRSNERRDVPDYLLFNDTEKYQQVMSKELKELRPEEKFCLGVRRIKEKK